MTGTTTKSPLSRAAAAALGVLAMLASVLVVTGLTAAPAQAAEPRYGYVKVQTPEPYLTEFVLRGGKVLFVDTEHATPDGFWFAAKSSFDPQRDFAWVYQPYGVWCESVAADVKFNSWMNTHGCMVDGEKIAAAGGPDWAPNTTACRARTGLPWKTGSMFANQESYCLDTVLDWNSTQVKRHGSTGYTCAPWEDNGLTPSGGPKCVRATYPWADGPINTFWAPAPDTCTGMPANTNKSYNNPTKFAPVTGGDGSCTGAALAPNCPTASRHEACTGVPTSDQVWATATRTANVPDAVASESSAHTATQKVMRVQVTRSATKTYRGKKFTASATQRIWKSATRSATRFATASDGSATRTATKSCSASSAEEAQTCAANMADTEATRLARVAARADASGRALSLAAAAARRDSIAAALAVARTVPVTSSDRKSAGVIAKRKAVKKVDRMIQKYKQR